MLGKFLLSLLALGAWVAMDAQETVYIFGGPGTPNGEFDGGLNDWVTEGGTSQGVPSDAVVWEWIEDGTASKGSFWGNRTYRDLSNAILSPSVANGAAVFDSDFLDSNGEGESGIGNGTAPSPQEGFLISPSFDCSTNNTVFVTFNQYHRNFDAITRLDVSIDGGQTWVLDTVNKDFSTFDEVLPNDQQLIDITDIAAGQSDVKIRFAFVGDYYFWIIDDVAVIEQPPYAIQSTEFFMPLNAATPASQITTDSSTFSINIENTGAEALTNVTVGVEVTDENDMVVYSDTTVVMSLQPNTGEITVSLPGVWAPGDLELGTYQITYDVQAPDQEEININVDGRDQRFIVTQSTYSKELSVDFATDPVEDGDWIVGNHYFTADTWTKNTGFIATNAQFAVAIRDDEGTLPGKSVIIDLVEVDASVAPDWSNFDADAPLDASNPQLKTIGTATHSFTDEAEFDLIDVELLDIETFDPGVSLKPGTRYFLIARYQGSSNVLLQAFNDDISYNFVSTVVFLNRWSLGGFGPENAAVMRMIIAVDPSTSADVVALPEHTVKVFPNPAKDYILTDLAFDTPQKGVVVLADITGRVLEIKEIRNQSDIRFRFDTNKLANGTYLVRVATNEGAKTTKVVVQH